MDAGRLVRMQDASRECEDLLSWKRLRFAMSILEYNQSFVHVTDGKANTLLLVNSIFLATAASGACDSVLRMATLAVGVVSILLCLTVVAARLPGLVAADRARLVFFGHIIQRRNPAAFAEDFESAGSGEVTHCLIRQIYDLAQVVNLKFRAFRRAQLATMCSAVLWIGSLVGPALEVWKEV